MEWFTAHMSQKITITQYMWEGIRELMMDTVIV